MGRTPCCSREGINRGTWTALEDRILTAYIKAHGEGNWRYVPRRSGLKRCGKSCRLRWVNYLKPDIKRGNISHDEEELIIRLHNLLGNKWSLIAGRIPGRTDNEIKNYWNTTLRKKVEHAQLLSNDLSAPLPESSKMVTPAEPSDAPALAQPIRPRVVRAKPLRCTTTQVLHDPARDSVSAEPTTSALLTQFDGNDQQSSGFLVEFELELQENCYVPSVDDIPNIFLGDDILPSDEYGHVNNYQQNTNSLIIPTDVGIMDYRTTSSCDFSMDKDLFDMESLVFLLDNNS